MTVEHLFLHMRRTHWETKNHPDLGHDLQEALDHLQGEGWEVCCTITIGGEATQGIILKRVRTDT